MKSIDPASRPDRRWRLNLLLIILVGFGLRLYRLGLDSLWYDETVSAFLASLSLPDLLAHTALDIHPPGYYLLLHLWAALTGPNEFALAYLSLIFGLLLIPLTFSLARRLTHQSVATPAALLVAVSPFNLWYSQEVRMYTVGAALGLLAAICALQAQRSIPARRYWAGYIISAAAGLYALYYFSFLLIVLNLFWLGQTLVPRLDIRRLKKLLLANLAVILLYLPWLPLAWQQAINPPVPPWRTMPSALTVAVESWSALSLGQAVEPVIIWPVLLLILAVFGLGLLYLRRFPPAAPILLAYTFGPLLLIYLLSFITPLYHVRYLFTYSPPFYIILGAGYNWLTTRIKPVGAAIVMLMLLTASGYAIWQYHVAPANRPDDFRSAAAFLSTHYQPGDALLANAGYTYPALLYYADLPGLQRQRLVPYRPAEGSRPTLWQTGTVDGSPQLGFGHPQADFYAMPAAETIAALSQLAADHPRLWQLRAYDTVTDPTGLIRAWLAENAIPLEDQLFSGPSNIRVQGFLLTPSPVPPGRAVPFADGMTLLGWQLPPQNWPAGQTIPLKLWWSITAPPTADYKLSLKLWRADGTLAAQGRDEWPGGTLYRPTGWTPNRVVYHPASLILPADLPPGQYWLNLELYHPETIQPLPRQDDGSAAVTLGPVQVVASP